MHADPCPSELVAPLDPERRIEQHRSLFCGCYDHCLDEAVRKGWSSWTCARCPLSAVQWERPAVASYALRRLA